MGMRQYVWVGKRSGGWGPEDVVRACVPFFTQDSPGCGEALHALSFL